jgi:hypothetical protein
VVNHKTIKMNNNTQILGITMDSVVRSNVSDLIEDKYFQNHEALLDAILSNLSLVTPKTFIIGFVEIQNEMWFMHAKPEPFVGNGRVHGDFRLTSIKLDIPYEIEFSRVEKRIRNCPFAKREDFMVAPLN